MKHLPEGPGGGEGARWAQRGSEGLVPAERKGVAGQRKGGDAKKLPCLVWQEG